jgi:hypothetical protein
MVKEGKKKAQHSTMLASSSSSTPSTWEEFKPDLLSNFVRELRSITTVFSLSDSNLSRAELTQYRVKNTLANSTILINFPIYNELLDTLATELSLPLWFLQYILSLVASTSKQTWSHAKKHFTRTEQPPPKPVEKERNSSQLHEIMNYATFHEVLWKVLKDGEITSKIPSYPQTCKEFIEANEFCTDQIFAHSHQAGAVCGKILPKFSKFFHVNLDSQNEMLTKYFSTNTHSNNFIQSALQTQLPAPYLSLIANLMAYVAVASFLATKKFFNLTMSDDSELAENLGNMDSDDDLFGNVLTSTSESQLPKSNNEHQSSPLPANTNAPLPDATDDQMLVDQSQSSQEKGKSREDDPPLE